MLEIKPIKLARKPGTIYCLGCKDYINNFKSQKVKMTNKVVREKSSCVDCQSNKSRFFLKQKHNCKNNSKTK